MANKTTQRASARSTPASRPVRLAGAAHPVPAPAPVQALTVHAAVDGLEGEINYLENQVAALINRLEPVAGSEPPTGDCTKEEPAYEVPLAARLNLLRCRLAGVSGRVDNVLGRLEV